MPTLELRKLARDQPALTTADSSMVFLVKSLLFPIIPVVTLLICLWANGIPFKGPYFLVAVLAFVGAADFLGAARFRAGVRRSDQSGFFALILRWTLLMGAVFVVLYLAQLHELYDLAVLTPWALTTPLALWMGQLGANEFLVRIGVRHKTIRKAVIVGLTQHGVRLEKSLLDDKLAGIRVVAYFEDRATSRDGIHGIAPVVGATANLAAYVLQHGIKVVYVTLPMSRNQRILDMLEALRDSTASIYFVPDLFVFDLIQARFDVLNGIPVVAVCETPLYGVLPLVKRLTDMSIAAAVLLVTLPVFIAVSIGIRLGSRGPVLFKQKRYGLDGREIWVYKFRSMSVTEDGRSNYTQVAPGDSRVTRIGAFLRKTSLDELPQFINVLQGSMSVVGPRPHAIAVNERYRQLIPSYMSRHMVKPGITGWAQVNGYRGGDDLESMTKRIEYDLDYLRYWSPWLDFLILLKTATIVWNDRRAY